MLKYPCLVLDHDDTVVQSEKTVAYPCFCEYMAQIRPGVQVSFEEYARLSHQMTFTDMCRTYWNFTDEEMNSEYLQWKEYVRHHAPAPFPGIRQLLHRYRQAGGIICVSSLSGKENILRDYDMHFDLRPDAIYDCELPEEKRKPSPYALIDIMQKYRLRPNQILMVDDAKLAHQMTSQLDIPLAFAAWSKPDFPDLIKEMTNLCEYAFHSPTQLESFLLDPTHD